MHWRIRKLLLSCLCCVSCTLFPPTVPAQDTYTVGIVPQFDSHVTHSIWRPILDTLQAHTGQNFVLRGSPGISDFELEFEQGAFDFAYMNPIQSLKAYETQRYQPLVRDHQQALRGIVVVRADNPITTVQQLHHKELAFPSANALGATLMTRSELLDKYQVEVKPLYVHSHSSVYLNVVLGQVVAGGGVQKTLELQKKEIRDRLRVFIQTDKVNAHPFSAHPRVDKQLQDKVRSVLIEMGDTPQGRTMLARIPIKQIGAASILDYLPIKKLGLERFYQKEE